VAAVVDKQCLEIDKESLPSQQQSLSRNIAEALLVQ
jgi:hypothetical protein